MKKIFRLMAILTIAAFTLSTVSCSKDDNDNKEEEKQEEQQNQEEENQNTEPETNPYEDWDGAWGVIGDFNSWGGDVEMTKGSDGWYVADVQIPEGGTLEFKFRRDATWGDYEFGLETAGVVELDKEIELKPKGGNLKVENPGLYKMMLKPTEAKAKISAAR